eukprot:1644659-Rhodomonas_salina.1
MPAHAANSEILRSNLFMSLMFVARRDKSSAKQAEFLRTPHAWTTPTPAVPRCLRHRFKKKIKRLGLSESPCGEPL